MKKAANTGLVIVFVISCLVYFSTQVRTIVGGDAGDLLSAIATTGISHPPGYPLYTLLGLLIRNFIPFGNPAYKISFLSTIPSIAVLVLLYLLLSQLTSKSYAAVISVLILAFSNLYWLYSVVVEVFSLSNFFLAALYFLTYLYYKSGKLKYLYLDVFVLGLSLTHHHLILFLLPSLIFLIYPRLRIIPAKIFSKSILYFLSGLVPYLYVFAAAQKNPSINWMGEATIVNFIKLVTRSMYGSFVAGVFISQAWWSRLTNILGFFFYLWQDFTLIPIILIFSGTIYLYIVNRKIFIYFLIAFLSYLFFLFYASFPLSDNFMLATYERFLLPLFIINTIPLCFGLVLFESLMKGFYRKFIPNLNLKFLNKTTLFVFSFIPFLLFIKNYPKISSLKNDNSAEYFAEDILNSVDKNGILFISSDTPLFDSQYVYYSTNNYSKVKLIHFSKLYLPFYIRQINRDYPDFKISKPIDGKNGLVKILSENGHLSIYSKDSFEISTGQFLPWGLLYKYFPDNSKINAAEVIRNNEDLWKSYHLEILDSKAVSNSLFLNDILRYYMLAHQEIALYEARFGYLSLAIGHLKEAKKLDSHDQDSYILLAQVYIKDKKCIEADDEINTLSNLDEKNNVINYLKYLNYSLCLNNEKKAKEWLSIYEKNEEKKETPLETL